MIAHRHHNAIRRRDEWNAAHPIGTFVRYWQSMPVGDWVIGRTCSQAFLHGHGAAVHVRGTSQPVYLSNLEAVSQETLAAILGHSERRERPRGRESALPVGDRGGV